MCGAYSLAFIESETEKESLPWGCRRKEDEYDDNVEEDEENDGEEANRTGMGGR